MAMAANAVEVVVIPTEMELKKAAEKLEAKISKNKTKMHRFPESMRSLGNDGSYVVPNVVAIGPYHHHKNHLREAEEVKRAAAYYFCRDSRHPTETVYEKIVSVAGEARSCYADDAVEGISEPDFADMMFHDGCFLIQWMMWSNGKKVDPPLESCFKIMSSIARDVFLLENQIPRLVLDALMELRPVSVHEFIANMRSYFYVDRRHRQNEPVPVDEWPHLLDLLRCCVSGSVSDHKSDISFAQTSSAIELGQIGIKLTASRTTQLKDVGIRRGHLCGELFVTPFLMNNRATCWLVNMVALEDCIYKTRDANFTIVGSYIAIMAMLMNREEDVHKLRAKGLVYGKLSDQETLEFFKTLVKHAYIGPRYMNILAEIEAYKHDRWLWIAMRKLVYNNIKIIVTVFSVVGVLVGIFKTLISVKKHHN
ncbi:hypothetical protein ABZP36_034180 [Zizania latifolia]